MNGSEFFTKQRRSRGQQPRWSWILLAAGLITILMLTLSVSGCCSAPTEQVRPQLPAGKPKRETAAALSHELLRHVPPGSTADVTLPRSLLVRIFGHLDEWRAWALALEQAGLWAE